MDMVSPELAPSYRVFPGVEHRECMRHLAANFGEVFEGKLDENL
jgi:hypothetical protein